VIVFLLAWRTIAPVQVGGSASYVITDGISMLPKFVGDGLVITRAEGNYHVGEVAAYHNADLKAVVMHRIVALEGNRYVFKGDNNDFSDQYHPTKADLVGKEWVYWPGAGRYLKLLREPLNFAIVIGIVALLSLRMPRQSRRRRRHHA
jgi:signal peptidase I